MNDEKEVERKMIEFIEQKEREIPVDKVNEKKTTNEIVSSIIEELEKVIKHED